MNSNLAAVRSDDRIDQRRSTRLPRVVPILIFIGIAIMFAWGLAHNPREIPSNLIGKPVPQFNLPPVKGRMVGLSTDDLRGEVSLVNVFASWCAECRLEHPLIVQLNSRGVVTIHGLNYKDRPDDAARWLNTLGDPYARTGADVSGRVGIDWGVYGVPETFVVSKDGRIAYKHIGPLSAEVLEKNIVPLVETLKHKSLAQAD